MDWSTAYARQSLSDFEARDRLLATDLPQCHQLHYLQMALEKLAKAHLIATGTDPAALDSSHAYIAGPIPTIVKTMLARTPGRTQAWVVDAVRDLARRIELLAPAVRGGGAVPSNTEYPWQNTSGEIIVPAEHEFGLNLIFERAGVTMIKTARARALELAGDGTSR